MRLFAREAKVPAEVVEAAGLERGDRVLGHARDGERWLLGTRRAFVVVDGGAATVRLAWESVQAADWDRETELLTVSEVGQFGRPRSTWTYRLADPAVFLQVVRERVTASIVLQRGHLVSGKRGLKVIGRRSPEGGPITWMHEYDPGLDPDDPEVAGVAAALLQQARADVGE